MAFRCSDAIIPSIKGIGNKLKTITLIFSMAFKACHANLTQQIHNWAQPAASAVGTPTDGGSSLLHPIGGKPNEKEENGRYDDVLPMMMFYRTLGYFC